MKLYLVRHFAHNGRQGAYYGSTDLALKNLSSRPLELERAFPIYCSPMLRCTQSADCLSLLDKTLMNDAREIDFGDWEGKTFDEINSANSELVDEWGASETFSFPGGESLAEFESRVAQLLEFIMGKDEDCLLLSHGGVIRTLICLTLGLKTKDSLAFKVDLGSLSCLELYPEGKGVLNFLNNRKVESWAKLLS